MGQGRNITCTQEFHTAPVCNSSTVMLRQEEVSVGKFKDSLDSVC